MEPKNLGRLWLAYTELQGGLYMLELLSVDSKHFTPELQNGPHIHIPYGYDHSAPNFY